MNLKNLVNFILLLTGIMFLYGIGKGIYVSITDLCLPEWVSKSSQACELNIHSNLVFITTSIGGVLATNFGAIVGLPKNQRYNAFLFSGKSNDKNLQVIAAYLYVLGLLAAFIAWGIEDFTDSNTKMVPLIVELSKSFIGIMVGVLAVGLIND